jgi:hypothetical protein
MVQAETTEMDIGLSKALYRTECETTRITKKHTNRFGIAFTWRFIEQSEKRKGGY